MKKILAMVFAALLVVSCGSSYRMTRAEQEALAADVAWSVDNMDLIIDITAIYPFQGPSIMSSREYSMVIHDGVVRTRLPFLGESRTAVIYGVDDASIVLEDEPYTDLTVDRSRVEKKGQYEIYFQARRRQTIYHFSISVFENGGADIRVTSPSRTPMHYSGELYFEPEKP